MKIALITAFSIGAILVSGCSTTGKSKNGVYFKKPTDGGVVNSKFQTQFGVRGMSVKPAGTDEEGTGHHHVIIDGKPVAKGEVVPANKTHIHFGGGQTKTSLKLKPGKHTLTLQFADGKHQSYGPEWSETITVTVQ